MSSSTKCLLPCWRHASSIRNGKLQQNIFKTFYTSWYKHIFRNFHLSPKYMIRRIRKVDPIFEGEMVKGKPASVKSLLEQAVTSKSDKFHEDDIWHSDTDRRVHKYRKMRPQQNYRVTPPSINPKATSIVLFPGQGTQFVGMGKELLKYPNVQPMFDIASEILQYDILKMCLKGPASDLHQTKYQQPAIFLSSLAAIEKLREENLAALESCVGVAGFSVGEITALTFAGAFSFENAVRLVKIRGEAMQIASEFNKSGMMTVFYGPDSRLGYACTVAAEYCKKMGIEEVDCKVANYLFPSCKVVAGNEEALQFIIKNKEDFKLRRIRRLDVSGAFHTNLMKPAALVFREALESVPISNPIIPVYSNVDGRPYGSQSAIKRQLPKQIFSPVRWEQTMHTLYARSEGTAFPQTFECGPGTSLKTILKMVNLKASASVTNVTA